MCMETNTDMPSGPDVSGVSTCLYAVLAALAFIECVRSLLWTNLLGNRLIESWRWKGKGTRSALSWLSGSYEYRQLQVDTKAGALRTM